MPVRLILLVLLLFVPRGAGAWCLQEKGPQYRGFWGAKFPDFRIRVFVSVGENSSFLHTGLSLPQAEALVRRVVAVHNETVGPPYLFYAGTTDRDLGHMDDVDSMWDRPPGIVIDSFSCAQPLPYPCASNVHACAVISGASSAELVSKGRVTFQPVSGDCPPFGAHSWDLDPNLGPDAAGILLHEIGHVLGLDHTDLGPEACGGPTDGAGGSGVMRAPPSAFFPTARDWRRDDLEGLRVIWGDAIEHAVYTWQDSSFPANPPEDARMAVCAGVRTPPTVTGSVTADGAVKTQYIVFTDEDDRVAHLEWDGVRFAPPAVGAVIDAGPLGRSFASPAIAHSDHGAGATRVFAIWSAGESKTSDEVRLRWASRDAESGLWTYGSLDTPNGPTQRSKDVAVGFDAATSLFVVTSITDEAHPYFVAVDHEGHQAEPLVLGSGPLTPPFVFDIGKASCFADGGASRCVVPYISSEFDVQDPDYPALRSGWYDVELQPDGTMMPVDDILVPDFQPRGMVDLASGPDGLRGVVGDRRYVLDWLPGGGATDTPLLDTESFPGEDWPVRVGSQTFAAGATTYRIAGRRLGRLCGNGELDCDEACDDGNALDSDGCSAACILESSPTTGEVTTEGTTDDGTTASGTATEDMTTAGPASASDTGPVADEAGCGCTSANSRAAGLLVLVLAARRRRGWRQGARG